MRLALAITVFALALSSCAAKTPRAEQVFTEPAVASAPVYEISVVIAEAPHSVVERWIDAGSKSGPIVRASVADGFLAAATADGTIIRRPKIVVNEGALASIVNSRKVEYVKDVTPDDQDLKDTIEEGLWIEATPTHRDDGRVDVALSIRDAVLAQPIRESRLTNPASQREHTIQLPESTTNSVHTTLTLSSDEAALVPLRMKTESSTDRVRVVVLRVHAKS